MRADWLLGRLSDLLRASLRASDAATVPLKEELALLGAYTELMEARFGTRLAITVNHSAISRWLRRRDRRWAPPILAVPS